MNKSFLLAHLDELRKQYADTKDEPTRKVIAIRGKLLKRALEIMENKEPPQQSFIQENGVSPTLAENTP